MRSRSIQRFLAVLQTRHVRSYLPAEFGVHGVLWPLDRKELELGTLLRRRPIFGVVRHLAIIPRCAKTCAEVIEALPAVVITEHSGRRTHKWGTL